MADPPKHFFKFIPPTFKLNLSIPRSFLPNLNCGRCSKAILRRGGHEWPVDITDGDFSGDGWRECFRENGVQEFDFMVFKHQGNMVFEFLVFDPSTCEKQYPNLDVEDQPLTESEYEKEEKCRIGDDRCFVFKITPYYINSSNLVSIPMKFARSNGLISKWIRGQVIIRDETRRTWPATLKKTLKNKLQIRISVCREFKVKNHLKIGDTCMFELIKCGEVLVFNFYNIGKKPIKNYARVKKEINSTIKKATRSTSNNHPYFTSTLKPCSIKKSCLYLPNEFAKKNGLFNNGEIILRNGKDERSWIVELKNHKNKYCYIGRGWKDFRVANGLKERDCYKFQIVDKIGEKLVVNFYALKNPSRFY